MVNAFLNDKSKLDVAAIFKAEREFYESKSQFDLDKMPGAMEKLTQMEAEIKNLTEQIKKWGPILERLDAKNSGSQQQQSSGAQSQVKAGGDAGGAGGQKKSEAKPATADDDIDLFGSDEEEEDEEAKKLREERLAAYDTKKAKKPALIAKSSIVLEVKPWDDETDVHEMEKAVRSIEMDGLLWGASKFVEIAYGIKKLQISAVVEDDKVSVDLLEEKITDFEELVQSVDIASFNKI